MALAPDIGFLLFIGKPGLMAYLAIMMQMPKRARQTKRVLLLDTLYDIITLPASQQRNGRGTGESCGVWPPAVPTYLLRKIFPKIS